MARKPVYISQVGVERVPTVSFSGTSAVGQALYALSDTLARAGGQYWQIHAQEALQEARDTAIANVERDREFQPVRKHGAFWREYNATGLAAYKQEIELSTRQNIARIAAENRFDPLAMEKSLADYSSGVEKELPTELRRAFAKDFEIWSRPHITAAVERELDAAAKSAKHSLSALLDQRHDDARGIGGALGGADPSTPTGQASIAASGQALASIYDDTLGHLQQMIDNNHMTLGEAEAALEVERAAITKSLIAGAFDAAENKEQFFLDFVEGKVVVPIPQVVAGPDGEAVGDDALTFAPGNPMDVMDIATFDDLRASIGARVSAIQSARNQARLFANAQSELSGKVLLNEFYKTRDPELLDRIEGHMGISLTEKNAARTLMRDEGTQLTDWQAFEDVQRTIAIAPEIVTQQDILNGPYSRREEQALLEALEARHGLDHFANSENYKQAALRIDRVVGQMSSDIVQVIGGTSAEASSSRMRAAALLKQRLYDTTLEFQRQNFEVGTNPSGKPVEIVGDIKRFDPEAYMRGQIAGLRTEAKARMEPIEGLRGNMRDLQRQIIEARRAGDHAKATQLGQQMLDLQKRIREATNALDLSTIIMMEEAAR